MCERVSIKVRREGERESRVSVLGNLIIVDICWPIPICSLNVEAFFIIPLDSIYLFIFYVNEIVEPCFVFIYCHF